MKTIAYLRISIPQQDVHSQRLAIVEYARTREGLAKASSSGKKIGRPDGSLCVPRLDGEQDEVRRLLKLGVRKRAILQVTWVSRPTHHHFIGTRGITPGAWESASLNSICAISLL